METSTSTKVKTYTRIYFTNGTSSSSEPSFSIYQNEITQDNTVKWETIPDTKPESGKNWKSYWVLDSNLTTGSAYSYNYTYRRCGDFYLPEDVKGKWQVSRNL